MLLLYVTPLIFCAVLGPILAFLIVRRGQSPGAQALVAIILAAALWATAYAVEIISPTLPAKIFWAKFQYFGIATLPTTWLIFSARYLGPPEWLKKFQKYNFLLAVIPLLTLAMVWTNDAHHLFWKSAVIEAIGSVNMLVLEHGFFFYVYWIYSNTLVLIGTIWLVAQLFTSNTLMRQQIGLALVGAVIPWVGNIIYVSGFNPLPELDWTPLGFTVSSVFFTLSISRYHLARVVPVALRVVFEEVSDSMLVLDPQNRIVDLNLAARKLTGSTYLKLAGKPLTEAIPELYGMIPIEDGDWQVKGDITLTRDAGPQFYDFQVMTLTEASGEVMGRLVVLHDITRRRQEQAQLEQAYARLEDRVSERTEALQKANLLLQESHDQLQALTSLLQEAEAIDRRKIAAELHDRVGQNLTALNLNLKRLQNKLSGDNNSAVLNILTDSAGLLEETTRQVRTVMADLNPPMLDEYGLVPALTWYCEKFYERTGISIHITGEPFKLRLPARVEAAIFRIAQECLNNIAKHSQATQVQIEFKVSPDSVVLCLEDNGSGFDLESVYAPGKQAHWGLLTMRERALSIGGEFKITTSPGKGARIELVIRRNPDDDNDLHRR